MGNAQAAALPPGPRKPHIVPPGAYSVPGNPTMRANQQFYVVVPKGAYPGVEFPVLAGGYQLMVRCPDSCKAGDRIVVSAPHKKRNTESFLATVPDRINPGDHFAALINGRERIVTCPPGVGPGMKIRILVTKTDEDVAPAPFGTTKLEVTIPKGVGPGQSFAILAKNMRVLVTCPPTGRPGEKMVFNMPNVHPAADIRAVNLKYEKEGWTRCLTQDLKFQWLHQNATGKPEQTTRPGHGLTKDKMGKLAWVRIFNKNPAAKYDPT